MQDAWYNKGVALNDLGKYDEAIKAYDRAIELNPEDSDAWCNKGVALYYLGKYDEAIKTSDKTIELNPEDCRCLEQQRRCSLRAGQV